MGYAYLDKGGNLRISASKNTVAKYSHNGKVVATEHRATNGYPIVNGERVFMYSVDEIYIGGNANSGKRVTPGEAPFLVELYKSLM